MTYARPLCAEKRRGLMVRPSARERLKMARGTARRKILTQCPRGNWVLDHPDLSLLRQTGNPGTANLDCHAVEFDHVGAVSRRKTAEFIAEAEELRRMHARKPQGIGQRNAQRP